MKIFQKIFSPFCKKAENVAARNSKPSGKIAKITYEDVDKYVPQEAQQFKFDPEVRDYYWRRYWNTTPEGQAEGKEISDIIKKLLGKQEA